MAPPEQTCSAQRHCATPKSTDSGRPLRANSGRSSTAWPTTCQPTGESRRERWPARAEMLRRADVRHGPGAGARRERTGDLQGLPPRQKPDSFSIDHAIEKLMSTERSTNLCISGGAHSVPAGLRFAPAPTSGRAAEDRPGGSRLSLRATRETLNQKDC